MFDAAPAPDLALLLGPDDLAEFVAIAAWRARRGRVETSWLYVVLHRAHGDWTHAYRVVPDRRPGHLAVFIERVEPGDRRAALADWLRARVAEADPRR